MDEPTIHLSIEEEENQLVQARLHKLHQLREQGNDPFVVEKFECDYGLQAAHDQFESLEGQTIRVAGRIFSVRNMGKACFIHLMDSSGKLQIYLRKDEMGDAYNQIDLWDIGDFLGAQGFLFRTKTGEITLHAQQTQLLSKCVRPIPFPKEKGEQRWYGLHDIEQRYRQRYLDLLTNPDSRHVLIARSRIIAETRRFLEGEGFLEVETPMLQPMAGGAAARPFKTRLNALDMDMQLRISLELYLKRLLVGGIDRVFEIGRVFRNEGISTRHNPEFTLLELYQAYANLEDMMSLVERLFLHVAERVFGTTRFEFGETIIDFSQPWTRLDLVEAVQERTGLTPDQFETLESARKAADSVGLASEKRDSPGIILEKLLEKFVEPTLIQPTFITGYPLDTSPFAKIIADRPNFTRRFEGYLLGREMSNAFSELNDPLEQRERFERQSELRQLGDEEAHPYDEDFIHSMEYGMPPTGGLGIGMDRMVMLLTGAASIRDVILFPLSRNAD